MHSGTNMYFVWVPYVFKRQSSSKILPGGNESNWLNAFKSHPYRRGNSPFGYIMEEKHFNCNHSYRKSLRVMQFAVWPWVWTEKQPWQITPFIHLMQLLCSYNSGYKVPMWEQNPSENKWDLLWSCASHRVTSSLVAENGQGCSALLLERLQLSFTKGYPCKGFLTLVLIPCSTNVCSKVHVNSC